jgi:hypothetical protein
MAGSTLGFLALLAGALFNARLNRQRDDRQRRHDQIALATSLAAELDLTKAIDNTQLLGSPSDADGFFVPLPSVSIIPKLIDRLGLLNSNAIKQVMAAHLVIEQTRRELVMLGATRLNNPDNDQLWLPVQRASAVIHLLTAKVDYINKALAALNPHAKQ